MLARLLAADAALSATLREMANPVLKNWNDIAVGTIRPAGAIA